VTVAVDAAITSLSRGCDLFLVGADSIGDAGVVNKIGTRTAAQSARSAGIPIYALADHSKLLPPGFRQPLEDDRPADEVWPRAPADVNVWNRYFEATPLGHFAGIVTESGLHTPAEVDDLRAKIELPVELRS
jgi:translation initiation factor 2B subunit (eIF-2B alpha/beta/delta family)